MRPRSSVVTVHAGGNNSSGNEQAIRRERDDEPENRLTPTLANAALADPPSASESVSSMTLENVMNPPSRPTKTNVRSGAGISNRPDEILPARGADDG
jgi:hypothetical protein